MLRKLCLACLLLCVLDWESSYAVGLTKQEREQNILKFLIDKDKYDKRLRPSGITDNGLSGSGGPTVVTVNLYIRSFDFVDEANMEYGVQLTFRQQWMDSRLAYNKSPAASDLRLLTLTDKSEVWTPDLFFSNEKTSHLHDLMSPNHYIRIFPDGEVLYSSRITMKLHCPMVMDKFPFDKQDCTMRMASYGYTKDDIIFEFKEVDPIQVTSELRLPKFTLSEFTTDTCDSQTNTGVYSCLKVIFSFSRVFSPYLISIYIPYTMIVIVAWLSCWLDQNSVTARILIGLSTLFVHAMQSSELYTALPVTPYTKAIDVWIGISRTFVFSCLVEFIIVNYLARSESAEENNKANEEPLENANNEEIPLNQKHIEMEVQVQEPKKNIKTAAKDWVSKFPSKSRKVDAIFRIAYPIVFVLFCLIYFVAY